MKKNRPTAPPPDLDDNEDNLPPSAPETQGDDDAFQQAADEINPDVSQRVWEWINKRNKGQAEITCTLYKEKPEGGKKQCGKWKNQIPDEHNVGLVHGSGRYEMIVTFPKVGDNPMGIKKANFELDKYYDQLKQEAQMTGQVPTLGRLPQAVAPQAVTVYDPNPKGDNTLEIIKTVFSMIQPMLQVQRAPDNTMSQMVQMYSMMNMIMKKSLMDNTDFMAEMQARLLGGNGTPTADAGGEDEVEPQAPEKPKTFLEQALPFIMPFLEKLTTGTAVEQTATANVISAIPAVQQIITDPKHKSDCKTLIAYLDKNLPKGKTDDILLKLKVDRAMYQ
jgi:hypothetical protein